MKKLLIFLFILSGCSKSDVDKEMADVCNNAKIIRSTCAGLVIQLLKDPGVGVDYYQFVDNNTPEILYKNCVIGFVPEDAKYAVGDTVSIKYKTVESWKGNSCLIGNVPKIMISISSLEVACPETK